MSKEEVLGDTNVALVWAAACLNWLLRDGELAVAEFNGLTEAGKDFIKSKSAAHESVMSYISSGVAISATDDIITEMLGVLKTFGFSRGRARKVAAMWVEKCLNSGGDFHALSFFSHPQVEEEKKRNQLFQPGRGDIAIAFAARSLGIRVATCDQRFIDYLERSELDQDPVDTTVKNHRLVAA